jgi:hypothetical protein
MCIKELYLPSHRSLPCWIFPSCLRFRPRKRPKPRRAASLTEARPLVDDLLSQRRLTAFRTTQAWLDSVRTEEEAVEAIGALRELPAIAKLLAA